LIDLPNNNNNQLQNPLLTRPIAKLLFLEFISAVCSKVRARVASKSEIVAKRTLLQTAIFDNARPEISTNNWTCQSATQKNQ
jgi:hypothetical protein